MTDPGKLGGAAHIRGTKVTVAEIRAAWREKGVYVADILKRFRKLKPDDVEAVLFHWADPNPPEQPASQKYYAEWAGPPRRKLYLKEEAWVSTEGTSGTSWRLTAIEVDDDGEEFFLGDAVDDTFAQITNGYPERFAPRDIVWRDAASHEIVDIYSLKAE